MAMGLDAIALGNRREKSRPPLAKWCALRHRETGLWFHVRKVLYSAEYAVSPTTPTVRSKATIMLWMNQFDRPEDWEIVEFILTPTVAA